MMNLVTLTKENLETEHICCAISNNRDCQVASKKAWLRERLDDGLIFTKGDVRGKCFIEYLPAEKAWAPVDAPGYMYIDCFWVSGQFKGHGNANLLLDDCIRQSRALGKKGLVALSSKKKLPFLSDPDYLAYRGFRLADEADPSYTLLYYPFETDADVPCFRPCVKNRKSSAEEGLVLYYSAQCPYTAKYVPLILAIAADRSIPFRAVQFTSAAEAQAAPSPFTAYTLFHNGQFLTHEIQSEPKFIKLVERLYPPKS